MVLVSSRNHGNNLDDYVLKWCVIACRAIYHRSNIIRQAPWSYLTSQSYLRYVSTCTRTYLITQYCLASYVALIYSSSVHMRYAPCVWETEFFRTIGNNSLQIGFKRILRAYYRLRSLITSRDTRRIGDSYTALIGMRVCSLVYHTCVLRVGIAGGSHLWDTRGGCVRQSDGITR